MGSGELSGVWCLGEGHKFSQVKRAKGVYKCVRIILGKNDGFGPNTFPSFTHLVCAVEMPGAWRFGICRVEFIFWGREWLCRKLRCARES